jgi:hypothetical protein
MMQMKSSVETILRRKTVEAMDEDEKLCKGYDEDESSVETIMRRKTVKVRMKTKSSV